MAIPINNVTVTTKDVVCPVLPSGAVIPPIRIKSIFWISLCLRYSVRVQRDYQHQPDA